jgi:hypothetical protein
VGRDLSSRAGGAAKHCISSQHKLMRFPDPAVRGEKKFLAFCTPSLPDYRAHSLLPSSRDQRGGGANDSGTKAHRLRAAQTPWPRGSGGDDRLGRRAGRPGPRRPAGSGHRCAERGGRAGSGRPGGADPGQRAGSRGGRAGRPAAAGIRAQAARSGDAGRVRDGCLYAGLTSPAASSGSSSAPPRSRSPRCGQP